MLYDFKSWLVVPVQQLIADPAGWFLVCKLERFRTVPLDTDHRNGTVWQYPPYRGTWL